MKVFTRRPAATSAAVTPPLANISLSMTVLKKVCEQNQVGVERTRAYSGRSPTTELKFASVIPVDQDPEAAIASPAILVRAASRFLNLDRRPTILWNVEVPSPLNPQSSSVLEKA